MNYQAGQFNILEKRFENLILDNAALRAMMAQLQTQLAALQQQPIGGGGGGGGGIFSMVGVVIAAGGSVTGATVSTLSGGSLATLSTNATVYNQMQVATVVTKTIMLGQNPDGTFSAISQSC